MVAGAVVADGLATTPMTSTIVFTTVILSITSNFSSPVQLARLAAAAPAVAVV